MIARAINQLSDSISWRFLLAMTSQVPVAITAAWLGAVWQNYIWGVDPVPLALRLFLAGFLPVLAGAYVMVYPVERWVIRDKAARSWKWAAVRVLLYIIIGLPLGFILLWGVRLGVRQYPVIIETNNYVTTVTNAAIVGVIYSFLERALEEVRRREAAFKLRIEQLEIQIDHARKSQQIEEITGTDYFRSLQERAQGIRKEKEKGREGN